MKVALIYNKELSEVINRFGIQNKERYSPETIHAVAAALEAGGHNASVIDGDMNVIESLQDFMPRVLEGEKMGMVFNMAYGIQGESRYTHIPALLEMLGVPYVGSTPAGHALALDKVITKIIMQKHGIPTPDFHVFNSSAEDMQDVSYPVIVKPKMEAVSFGLRVVNNKKELCDAVDHIVSEYGQQALVEQFIRGREFCVGLIGNNPVENFPLLEIDLNDDPDAIQTLEDKKKEPRRKICPAQLPSKLADEIIRWSKAAFQALGLRDFARVDIRLAEDGSVYLLEINSMASLGHTGSYYFASKAAGYDYVSLVNKMLDVASVRYFVGNRLPDLKTGVNVPEHVRIRGFLRSRQNYYESFLKKAVNLNTHCRNAEGVNSFGEIVKKEFLHLKFSCEAYPCSEIGNILYFTNTNEQIDILILGALDNDTEVSGQQYFRAAQQKFFGTGIWEHKGGIAVIIGALQSLRFIRKITKFKIGVLLTSDSSLHSRYSRKIIQQKSGKAKYTLGMHGAFLDGGLVTSRSGSAAYHLSLKLKDNLESANVPLAYRVYSEIINKLVSYSSSEDGLVIAPGQLAFNSNITEPYAHGEAGINIRFNESKQMDEVDRYVKRLARLRKHRNILDLHIRGAVGRPSMLKDKDVFELYELLKKNADMLDILLREEHRWSSADICYASNAGRLDGLGPVGIKPSGDSEYIISHSLLERMTLLAVALLSL